MKYRPGGVMPPSRKYRPENGEEFRPSTGEVWIYRRSWLHPRFDSWDIVTLDHADPSQRHR